MPSYLRNILSLGLVCFLCAELNAQQFLERSDSLNRKRVIAVAIGQGSLYSGSLGALQFAWYNQYQTGKFQLFNDWPGWMQMDKVGHAATAYQTGYHLYHINRWAGISERKAVWWAVGTSYSFQLAVEVMDGFSSGWGFSMYDLGFNTIGSGLFMAQQLAWKEQRMKMKFSFWPSGLAHLDNYEGRRARNLYGVGLYEQWLKDYNGQTYWLSTNLWSMLGKPDRFPKWVNLAIGYSTNNMLGAESNTWTDPDDATQMLTSPRERQRQLLLSLDIDLEHADLPRGLNWLVPVFGLVKLPFPALELNSGFGAKGHILYF